jgi:hypothetical protein
MSFKKQYFSAAAAAAVPRDAWSECEELEKKHKSKRENEQRELSLASSQRRVAVAFDNVAHRT